MLALLLATVLSVQPNPVYIERIGGKQAVNCDLIIENNDAVPVDIDEIDVAGVPAQSQVLVFNPFHTFDEEVELVSMMMFVVKLSTKDGKRTTARAGEGGVC